MIKDLKLIQNLIYFHDDDETISTNHYREMEKLRDYLEDKTSVFTSDPLSKIVSISMNHRKASTKT